MRSWSVTADSVAGRRMAGEGKISISIRCGFRGDVTGASYLVPTITPTW